MACTVEKASYFSTDSFNSKNGRRLQESPQWRYNRSPKVFAMLADLTEEEVVDMAVAGWDEHLPEIMMYGKGWNKAAASMFLGVYDYSR